MEKQQDSSESKQQQQEATPLAFKDFRNAVPLDEFESILKIARHEYDQLYKVAQSRDKFIEKSKLGLKQIKENESQMPPGLAEKLLEGLSRRADDEILKGYKGAIKRHKHVTDFLNRFQSADEELPYLEFKELKLM